MSLTTIQTGTRKTTATRCERCGARVFRIEETIAVGTPLEGPVVRHVRSCSCFGGADAQKWMYAND